MSTSPTVVSVLYLDPLKFGSVEEFTLFLSQALKKRGWRSVLVFASPLPGPLSSRFDEAGAIIETFSKDSVFKCYKSLMRILWKYRPEVVHFHFFQFFSVLPILASMARPKLLVFTDHVTQPNRLSTVTGLECLIWDRIVLRLLDTKILAVSNHIKKTLVNFYHMTPQRVQVLYNGINLERFVPLDAAQVALGRNEMQISPSQPVVICASNLRPEKGISDLLLAAKQVLASKPGCVFVIVGEGPMANTLRGEAQELGIQRNVRFLGLRSDVNKLMGLADVAAVPSTWQDPAPLVVVEAMAMVRPVVGTRVGGIPELLEDGVTGILVEPHAPDQLARAILRLLDSPAEAAAMGLAGRARVESHFTIERWASEIVGLYEKSLRLP